ncbi:MerR family transcriptional regulator [Kytococcus sedentarius]|uniref:MerR family transcriptional regulator n=1 Tax=Kytococcus sedentarius TaxID=1276 RepID=UPI0035BC8AA6
MGAMTNHNDLTVGQVAESLGVTVRTLHHYEAVGVAGASHRSSAGYRLYSPEDLARLERVVFLRRLGLSLEDITQVSDGGDVATRLRERREEVMRQVEQLTGVLGAIDTALEAEMNSDNTTPHGYRINHDEIREIFGEGYGDNFDDYQAEAEQRWGDTPQWDQSQQRVAKYSKADWEKVKAESDQLLRDLAAAMDAGEPATGERAMDAAEAHRQHIIEWFYDCTPEIHRGLGEMYVADERFRKTYEDVAPGLAEYARDAHAANADRQES